MSLLYRVAEKVINQPLMILPEKLTVVALVLEGRLKIDASDFRELADAKSLQPIGSRYVGEHQPVDPDNPKAGTKPYRMAGGAAIVPVMGSLVNRGGFLDAMSGITSYEKIKFQIRRAAADDAASAILLHIDSGGGEAIGAFGAADAVRAAASRKPVYAVTDGMCCSAAYAIASGASRIIAGRDSLVGSIGTALLHMDHSKLLADVGIKPTLFVTGKRKQQGHPFFELTDAVKGDLRDYVERVNANFIVTVANHRNIAAEAIVAQQAGVFVGVEAKAAGLVDEIADLGDVVADLQRKYPAPPRVKQQPPRAERWVERL